MGDQGCIRAREILDGSMLGDGNLQRWGRGAHYQLSLSKPLVSHNEDIELIRSTSLQEHLKYEQWLVKNAFGPLDVPIGRGYPKILASTSRGKPYQYARLNTRQSLILLELYDEWYEGGSWVNQYASRSHIRGAIKKLPERLMYAERIPLLTLASWFIEDGGSSWGYPAIGSPQTKVSFAVQNFTVPEVYHLAGVINNMGVRVLKPRRDKRVKSGSGLAIWLSETGDSIDYFMGLIEPYILEIFGPESLAYKHMIKWKPNRSKHDQNI